MIDLLTRIPAQEFLNKYRFINFLFYFNILIINLYFNEIKSENIKAFE